MEKRENVAATKRKIVFFTSFSVLLPLPWERLSMKLVKYFLKIFQAA
jgi:hypothetical protein